jgi:hypothetical protein
MMIKRFVPPAAFVVAWTLLANPVLAAPRMERIWYNAGAFSVQEWTDTGIRSCVLGKNGPTASVIVDALNDGTLNFTIWDSRIVWRPGQFLVSIDGQKWKVYGYVVTSNPDQLTVRLNPGTNGTMQFLAQLATGNTLVVEGALPGLAPRYIVSLAGSSAAMSALWDCAKTIRGDVRF